MEIVSNKEFKCYESCKESWNTGKDITLDGTKLIPIPHAFKINWGMYEDMLDHGIGFLIFGPYEAAKNFCENYITEEIEAEKTINDGKSHWWTHHSLKEVDLKELNNTCINIIYIEEES